MVEMDEPCLSRSMRLSLRIGWAYKREHHSSCSQTNNNELVGLHCSRSQDAAWSHQTDSYETDQDKWQTLIVLCICRAPAPGDSVG